MSQKAREKILKALTYEKFLTVRQIGRLFYQTRRDGQPAKSFSIRPRKKKVYVLEPGYYPAYRLLCRMAKDGIIARHKADFRGNPDLWSLPHRRPPTNWYGRQHELDCADLFVAFVKTRQMTNWDDAWQRDEDSFKKHKAFYDRRLELDGLENVVFFEVDRGTEDLETLEKKVRKYIKLSDANPHSAFTVIFTVQGYRWRDQKSRAEDILDILLPFDRGTQFVVAPHELLMAQPLDKCLIPPKAQSTTISIYDLDRK